MTLYHVHIYREMRLYFPAIEADSPKAAAQFAAGKPTGDAEYTEDCDGENIAALIDVDGDEQYSQSVTIDFEAGRLRKAAGDLLAALVSAVQTLENIYGEAEANDSEYLDELRAVIARAKGPAALSAAGNGLQP
jgi:hypothetical protein